MGRAGADSYALEGGLVKYPGWERGGADLLASLNLKTLSDITFSTASDGSGSIAFEA